MHLGTLQASPSGVSDLADALLKQAQELYGKPAGREDPLYGDIRSYLTDRHRHDFRVNEMREVLPRDFLGSTKRVLDVGCGPGIFTLRMAEFGHDACGIDVDETKIALGHAHVAESGFPDEWKKRLLLADGGALPFRAATFDLVASYHVLEHVADLRSVLYEAVRVTKPGGYLHLQAPDYRFSYDTHYCMPWPRMMPPLQAAAWARAMGRPTGGIETIYRVTLPEVASILEALDCSMVTVLLREHRDGKVHPFGGAIPPDPIVFEPDADLSQLAAEMTRLAASKQLPEIYRTCLEFTVVARRNVR